MPSTIVTKEIEIDVCVYQVHVCGDTVDFEVDQDYDGDILVEVTDTLDQLLDKFDEEALVCEWLESKGYAVRKEQD